MATDWRDMSHRLEAWNRNKQSHQLEDWATTAGQRPGQIRRAERQQARAESPSVAPVTRGNKRQITPTNILEKTLAPAPAPAADGPSFRERRAEWRDIGPAFDYPEGYTPTPQVARMQDYLDTGGKALPRLRRGLRSAFLSDENWTPYTPFYEDSAKFVQEERQLERKADAARALDEYLSGEPQREQREALQQMGGIQDQAQTLETPPQVAQVDTALPDGTVVPKGTPLGMYPELQQPDPVIVAEQQIQQIADQVPVRDMESYLLQQSPAYRAAYHSGRAEDLLAEKKMQREVEQAQRKIDAGISTPKDAASVQAWKYYQTLPPEEKPGFLRTITPREPLSAWERKQRALNAMPPEERAETINRERAPKVIDFGSHKEIHYPDGSVRIKKEELGPEQDPKLKAAQAAATARGQAEEKRRQNRPVILEDNRQALKALTRLRDSSGLENILGDASFGFVEEDEAGKIKPRIGLRGDTPTAKAARDYNFVISKQYKQAYTTLKGAGAITEKETQLVAAGESQLASRFVGPETYKQILNDQIKVISKGYFRLINNLPRDWPVTDAEAASIIAPFTQPTNEDLLNIYPAQK